MKSKMKLSRKEKTEKLISAWAFTILFALCIQFLVYLFIINIVPTYTKGEDGSRKINSLYYVEKYYVSKDGAGEIGTSSGIDNGVMMLYWYNMCLLAASIVLVLYYMVVFLENNEGKVAEKLRKFLKEQWPLTVLFVFMVWLFIGSLLAFDSYRSFIGCFNLKDGYFSFMMYGSMLICGILICKDKEKYKKILVNTFLITATILAALTIWNYKYLESKGYDNAKSYDITYHAKTIGEELFGNGGEALGEDFIIVTKRIGSEITSGIFSNSNHYGYYLSICVIVAATMFLKEKNIGRSSLYLVSYALMLYMAIINNTLGAYLGIGASMLFMIIYVCIPKKEEAYSIKEIVSINIIVAVFVILSLTTLNIKKENIVYNNFSTLISDVKILLKIDSNVTKGNNEDEINELLINKDSVESKESNVAKIGSGRGELWEKAAIFALQRPLFGYGLENILYQYNEQFGISEGRSHNLVLQLAATTGIVGMLLYVTGIASIWIRKLKYIKEWDIYECIGMFVIVSYIISSMTGNSAYYTSGYFYIFVSFIALSKSNESIANINLVKNTKSNKK